MIRPIHLLSVSAIVLPAAAWLAAVHAPDAGHKAANSLSILPSKIQRPASDAAVASQEAVSPAPFPADEISPQLSSVSGEPASEAVIETPAQFVWDEAKAVPVEPGSAGDTLRVQGQQVNVHSYQRTTQGNALAVVIKREELHPTESPATQAAESQALRSQTTEDQSPAAESTPPPSRSRSTMGFTYEEELFRAKWGWAAFAQVQREAALHPDDTP